MSGTFGPAADAVDLNMTLPDPQLRAGAAVATTAQVDPKLAWTAGALPCSALYLRTADAELLIAGCDACSIEPHAADQLRRQIAATTSLPAHAVLLVAGSVPVSVDVSSPAHAEIERALFDAALQACRASQPAELGWGAANILQAGTLGQTAEGLQDARVPILLVRSEGGARNLAALLVCSALPAYALARGAGPASLAMLIRRQLQENLLGLDCPVLFGCGPTAGRDSAEPVADRQQVHDLGMQIADAAERALGKIICRATLPMRPACAQVDSRELQAVRIGEVSLLGWPCDTQPDRVIALRKECPSVCVIGLANQTLQHYSVESPARSQAGAGNAVEGSNEQAGLAWISESLRLLAGLSQEHA